MITIIPAIDIIGGHCVRLTKGEYGSQKIYYPDPLDAALMLQDAGLKHLHVVDLDGARGGNIENLRALEKIAARTTLKIDYSGGIRARQAILDVINAGAAEVGIGSAAVEDANAFTQWLAEFGEAIVLGVDARKGQVAVKGWTSHTTATVDDILMKYTPLALKRAVYTDISRDGMLCGVDTNAYSSLQQKFPSVEITASGGISCMDDIIALSNADIKSVIVGKAIYEGKISLQQLINYAR